MFELVQCWKVLLVHMFLKFHSIRWSLEYTSLFRNSTKGIFVSTKSFLQVKGLLIAKFLLGYKQNHVMAKNPLLFCQNDKEKETNQADMSKT